MAPGPNSYRIRTPLHDARARRLDDVQPRHSRTRDVLAAIALVPTGGFAVIQADNALEVIAGWAFVFIGLKLFERGVR